MKATADEHPRKDQLVDFGLGKLTDEESAKIGEHLESCPDCQLTISDLHDDTFVALVRDSPPDDSAVEAGEPAHSISPDVTVAPDSTMGADNSRLGELPRELREHPRYEILELIGRGGMGDVYRAQHKVMNRVVALKVIKPELVHNEAAVERFRREVQAAARLHHANIVTAFDAEQAGDVHFLVMEFVAGVNLDEVLRQGGPLSVAEACECIRQTAIGLQYAHELGMVHRDVKPHNLIRATDKSKSGELAPDAVKILDFGLANFASESAEELIDSDSESSTTRADVLHQLTEMGSMMGTPDFVAPEQAEDAHRVDIRADIYSLGCTFFTLLTGRAPFATGTVAEKIRAHAKFNPPPLVDYRIDVPPVVEAILHTMMAKDPSERYQTPGEVAAALEELVIVSRPDSVAGVNSQQATAPVSQQARPMPYALVAIATMILALVACVAGVIVYVATDTGTIEIDNRAASIAGAKVVLTKNGERYATFTLEPGTTKKTIRAGLYEISVEGVENNVELNLSSKRIRSNRVQLDNGKQQIAVYRGDDLVIEVAMVASPTGEFGSVDEFAGEWKPLFNGNDLTGWKPHAEQPGNWRVENGAIVGSGDFKNAFLITERDDFEDFHLRVEARLNSVEGDSGVFIDYPNAWKIFTEITIGFDPQKSYAQTGSIKVYDQSEDAHWVRAPPGMAFPKEWFVLEVIARGRKVVSKLNGRIAVEIDHRPNGAKGAFMLQQFGADTVVEFRKIEVRELANAPSHPRRVVLSELGPAARHAAPSPDGLTIYWEADGNIWQASRDTVNDEFSNKRPLLKGTQPTISGDGLELVFLKASDGKSQLCQGTRVSTDHDFEDIRMILPDEELVVYPWISRDGKTLLYMRPGESDIQIVTRPNRISSWSKPKTITIANAPESGRLTSPSLSDDRKYLFATHANLGRSEGNLMVFQSTAGPGVYDAHAYIDIVGLPPLIGDVARYVASTNELYFTRTVSDRESEVVSVSNFVIPKIKQPTAIMKQVATYSGHQRPVKTVAFSPNGKYLASGSGFPVGDNTVRIWDRATGRELHMLTDHSTNVTSLAFSHNGNLLVTCDKQGGLIIWDAQTFAKLRQGRNQGYLGEVVFTSDDQQIVVVAGGKKAIDVIDPATASVVKSFPINKKIQGVALTPDGSAFAVPLGDGTVQLRRLNDGSLIREFEAATVPNTTLKEAYVATISPDGTKIAAGYKANTVRVWELATGRVLRDIRTANSGNEGLAFMADSRRLVTCGPNNGVSLRDPVACVVDTETGKVISSSPEVLGSGWAFALSPDNRFMVTGGGTYYDSGWKYTGNYELQMLELFPSESTASSQVAIVDTVAIHTGKVEGVAVSKQGVLLTVDAAGGMVLWDVDPLKSRGHSRPHDNAIWDARFTPDGTHFVTVHKDGMLRKWDTATAQQAMAIDVAKLAESEGFDPRTVAITPDGRHVAVGGHGSRYVVICNLGSGELVKRIENGSTLSLFYFDQGRKLVTKDQNNIRAIDVATGTTVWETAVPNYWAIELAISNDERFVAVGGRKGNLTLLSLADGTIYKTLVGHVATVNCLQFTADDRHLVTGSDDLTLRVWDVASGDEVARGTAPSHCLNRLAILPNGRGVISGGGGYYDDALKKYGHDRDSRLYRWSLPDFTWQTAAANNEVAPAAEPAETQASRTNEARATALQWLKHADAGEYEKCLELMTSHEEQGPDKEEIVAIANAARDKWGKAGLRREVNCIVSRAVEIRYRTKFEHAENTYETLILKRDSNQKWKVIAYAARNGSGNLPITLDRE